MKTAGQMLRDARIAKKLEFSDVSHTTKIRPEFLASIEADEYVSLLSGATARGFIRNYSEYLGLDANHVLAVFRRDFIENQQGQIVPRGIAEPVGKTSFWTPKSTIIALVSGIFVVFSLYLIYQYRVLTGPPPLRLISPTANQTVDIDSLVISGSTDPEATISINGQLVALDKGGTFTLRVPLKVGENQLSIIATSKSGRKSEITRTVTLTTAP